MSNELEYGLQNVVATFPESRSPSMPILKPRVNSGVCHDFAGDKIAQKAGGNEFATSCLDPLLDWRH
jgi:hypothetical protein